MKIRKLPKDPGPAAWNEILAKRTACAPLEHNITADWVVVGAGFAGLSAAKRLAEKRPNDRIVILEARELAQGPAGRNSGFMIDLPHDLSSHDYGGNLDQDRAQTRANRYAIEFAKNNAQEFSMPAEAVQTIGKINAARGVRGFEQNHSYSKHLDALAEPYEMLDAAQMRAATGIEYFRSGLFTPGAVLLQPALYIRGLGTGLTQQGVELFENSPVMSMDKQANWVLKTPKGQVETPNVILAVNGHLNSFDLYQGRLMHVFTYASMTRVLTPNELSKMGLSSPWGVTPSDPAGTTVRFINGQGGARIVVRNTFTFDPSLEISAQKLTRITQKHDQAFADRFPALRGIEMDYRWAGRLCISRNNVSVVRRIDDGLFACGCQNGLGTAKGTFGGVMVADLALGERSELLDLAVGEAAPQKLPPGPIATLGARAFLKWQEWQAGQEH